MNRLTLHFQTLPPWAPTFVHLSGCSSVKVVDPPEQPPFEGLDVTTIGRLYPPGGDAADHELIWQGAQGARRWVERNRPRFDHSPWVDYWELPNEPQPMWDKKFRSALDDFTSEAVHLMDKAMLCAVGLNFGVGWPDVDDAADFPQSICALGQHAGLVGLHEYCAPYLDLCDGNGVYWHTLRVRRTLEEWRAASLPIPPIYIGECGIDGGVTTPLNPKPRPYSGWRTYANHPRAYIAQLAWYEAHLPEEVIGAAVFNAGSYPPWGDFDIDEGTAMHLATYIRTGELPPA